MGGGDHNRPKPTTITGPNDARGCFFPTRDMIHLGSVFSLFLSSLSQNDSENGPKRRVWHRLGLRYSFLIDLIFLLHTMYNMGQHPPPGHLTNSADNGNKHGEP